MSYFTISPVKQFINSPDLAYIRITHHNDDESVKGTFIRDRTLRVHAFYDSIEKEPYVDNKGFLHMTIKKIVNPSRELIEMILGV